MCSADCSFYKIVRYQIDNNNWQGIVEETEKNMMGLAEPDCLTVSECIKKEINHLLEEVRKYEAVIKKLDVSLYFDADGLAKTEIYIIMAYQKPEETSSYWIRQIESADKNISLWNREVLGTIIEEFSFLPRLDRREFWKIENNGIYLFTPECVRFLMEQTDLRTEKKKGNNGVEEKETLLEKLEAGVYITRILAHSLSDGELHLYCGLTFQIQQGRRKQAFWTAFCSLKTSDLQFNSVFSRDMCQVGNRKYPWMLVKVNHVL